MLTQSFSPWPCYTPEEADAVRDIILSNKVNYWTGEQCKEFEKEFACWVNTKYAVALANGTAALEASLKALDIGPGDEVVVTSRSFFASASCIVNVGARPVFADVDYDSQNVTAETVCKVLTPKTKAIICVHLAGWPCEMDPILELAKENNVYVIEDCAQAHGALYKGRPAGSIGHIAAWSFCQDKIITTGGEGGMVTTSDRNLWSRVWSYKDHGKSWDAMHEKPTANGFRWVHESFGTNLRMTETQAVIGRIQLKRMPQWSEKRRYNAKRIWDTARGLNGLRVPEVPQRIIHAGYKCYIFVEHEKLKPGWNRDRIMNEISVLGVPCMTGSCSEIYLEKAFDGFECRPVGHLPVAKKLGDTSLMFLIHPSLTDAEIEKTCRVIEKVVKNAS